MIDPTRPDFPHVPSLTYHDKSSPEYNRFLAKLTPTERKAWVKAMRTFRAPDYHWPTPRHNRRYTPSHGAANA